MLPGNVRSVLGVSRATRLTLEQVEQLQLVLAHGMKDYW